MYAPTTPHIPLHPFLVHFWIMDDTTSIMTTTESMKSILHSLIQLEKHVSVAGDNVRDIILLLGTHSNISPGRGRSVATNHRFTGPHYFTTDSPSSGLTTIKESRQALIQ